MTATIVWFATLPMVGQILVLYAVAVNIVTFFYFGMDKMRSRNGVRRVSERRLWILSFLGGSIGALVGMRFFRHKTKKLSFQAGIAVILAIQIYAAYFFFFR